MGGRAHKNEDFMRHLIFVGGRIVRRCRANMHQTCQDVYGQNSELHEIEKKERENKQDKRNIKMKAFGIRVS